MKPAEIGHEVNKAIEHLTGAVPDVDGCLAHILALLDHVRPPLGSCPRLPEWRRSKERAEEDILRFAVRQVICKLPKADLLALLVAAADMRAEVGE